MPEFVFELPEATPELDASGAIASVAGVVAIDHTAAALNRLVTQFRKPNNQTLIRALCKPMQRIEQAFLDVIAARNVLDVEGESLLMIGRLVRQPVVDVEEATYKSLVMARIRANKSSGMGNQILRIVRLVLTDYASQPDVVAAGVMKLRLRNYGHAAYVLRVEAMDVPWDLAELVAVSFLRAITGTGIHARLDFVVQQDPDLDHYTEAFRFASVTDPSVGVGGYGSVTDATVGGEMAAAIE